MRTPFKLLVTSTRTTTYTRSCESLVEIEGTSIEIGDIGTFTETVNVADGSLTFKNTRKNVVNVYTRRLQKKHSPLVRRLLPSVELCILGS